MLLVIALVFLAGALFGVLIWPAIKRAVTDWLHEVR